MSKIFPGCTDPDAPRAYKKKTESMAQYIRINNKYACSCLGCEQRRSGMGMYCARHNQKLQAYAHPFGRAVKLTEIRHELTIAKQLLDINQEHASMKFTHDFIRDTCRLISENKMRMDWRPKFIFQTWHSFLIHDAIDINGWLEQALAYLLCEHRSERERLVWNRENAWKLVGRSFAQYPPKSVIPNPKGWSRTDYRVVNGVLEVIQEGLGTFLQNCLAAAIILKRKIKDRERVFNEPLRNDPLN